jgi:ABC-type phosphate/phosphonate transport system substrate-binding protein
MHLRIYLTLTLCCAGLLLGLSSAPAVEKPKAATLRVGVVKSLFPDTSEPTVQTIMEPFKKLLEADTGMVGEVALIDDPDTLGTQLQEKKVQLGVFQGVEFAWAHQKNNKLKPLLIGVNKDTTVKAALVVRADSKATTAADLHGQAVALPSSSHEHSRLFLQRRCVKEGETPEKSFSKITTPSTGEDALDDVVDGGVQAAVIDRTEFDAYKTNKPGRARKLKVLMESEPFPCGIVAYNPDSLDKATVEHIKTALLNSVKTQQGKMFLEKCRITHFEEVPDTYEELFKDVAKAYPPKPVKQP